ncbi:hypothetical protein [Nocardia sp. NPDC005366]|uniref:hypothetical protein n=1 Tax=Nocardia sp. NPDC005366 TaxID=3156878 RepID=UPI0033AB80A3
MSRAGRRATLPVGGSSTERGLLHGAMVVRCFNQDGDRRRDFDFARLPGNDDIRRALAAAFAARTAPGAGLTSMNSMLNLFVCVRLFARYLEGLARPLARLPDLTPEHIDGFYDHRRVVSEFTAWAEVGTMKKLLLRAEGLDEALVAKLRTPHPPRARRSTGKNSYSRSEFTRIAEAARGDLRAAAKRIRGNRALLERYRAGTLEDPDRRLELLDFVDRHADIPRHAGRLGTGVGEIRDWWVTGFGTVIEVVGWAHLTGLEAMAGAVLLTVMTGQNSSVVFGTPAAHHRTDGQATDLATAIVDTRKPRRGPRAYSNLVLSQVPDWINIPSDPDEVSARDELHTPFGVYRLLVELAARSRELIGADRLLIAYHGKGGPGHRRGLRAITPAAFLAPWSNHHRIPADDTGPEQSLAPLRVTMSVLRMTYLELHQKPVAHTESTLVNDYLARNRGNLARYRRVVADALAAEVDKARTHAVMTGLTTTDLARAQHDPDGVAAEHGIDAAMLKRMLGGELDTVMNACLDNTHSPHAPAGQPCRASFMQCLDCPCARALPRHLPIQVLVHDRLHARKSEMTPLDWARRFALPHAQLAELINRHDSHDIEDARTDATDTDRDVVQRFLNRELDQR